MKNASQLAALALIVGLTGAIASTAMATSTASADSTWQKKHSRREQVNARLANQNARSKMEVKEVI